MAKLMNQSLDVDLNAVNPTLVVRCEFEYFPNWEAPQSFSGELRLANGKRAASLVWDRIDQGFIGALTFPNDEFRGEFNRHPASHRNSVHLSLRAELSPLVIYQIEKLREADYEKAARFSAIVASNVLRSETGQSRGVIIPYFETKSDIQNLSLTAKQSEWVKKFAEPLGIGKFLLMELRVLDHVDIPESWKEVFERTQQRLQEMDQAIKHGDWYKAMDTGRKVFDNLKVFDGKPGHAALVADFDAALKTCNHSEDGIKDLKEGIKHLFHFGSKYVHDTSRTGVLNPAVVATREDAYMMYSIGLNILNVLGSKLHILSIRSSTP